MEVDSQQLIQMLEDKITLYKHLGIEVLQMTSERVHFRVSLEKSLNHKKTAFGGSLYACAVLAAYALILSGLKGRKIDTENIVIAEGQIKYLRPVDADFEVIAEFSNLHQETRFYSDLIQTGRTRGQVVSRVRIGGELKATMRGDFVVKTTNHKPGR